MTQHEELHDDDIPVGRVLSRREALALFGGAGLALVAGAGLTRVALAQVATATATPSGAALGATATALPSCVVRPALTEGPYFVDAMLNRSDIRIEPSDESVVAGILLKLAFHVTDVTDGTCKPLPGAQVDIWHCDAEGTYSGVEGEGAADKLFLRGYQVTDENGMAVFKTIYPGWYPGRTVHIHFKIRTEPEAETGYEFTSQLFFDDDLTDTVYEDPLYAAKGTRNTTNDDDNIFNGSEGLLTLELVPLTEEEQDEEGEAGYAAVFEIGLDLNDDTSSQSDFNQRGGPGGNRPPDGQG